MEDARASLQGEWGSSGANSYYPIHFSINDRNVGGRLGGLGNDAAARQSSDRGLGMEGADSEPESCQAVLSGILTYPNKSSILIHKSYL